MLIYSLNQLTLDQLQELTEIQDRGTLPALWEERKLGELTEEEQAVLSSVRKHLTSVRAHSLNEATIWARAIYPLLALAERDNLRAFAAVPMSATLSRGELRGEVDGVLARVSVEVSAVPPYLVVVEAKRGIEGNEPAAQLLGGLLCAAWQNHKRRPRPEQRLYGVITVADVWTFVSVLVSDLDAERPRLTTAFSREYMEKTEATQILLLLKSMVAELLQD